MMEQEETIRLLQECDAGVQMGITSIQEVLPYVKEGKFRQLLLACRDKHEKLQEEIQPGTGSQPGRGERAEPDGKGHVLDEDQGKTWRWMSPTQRSRI